MRSGKGRTRVVIAAVGLAAACFAPTGAAALADSNLTVTLEDAPDPLLPPADLTYTITVSNRGSDAAVGVQLHDALPQGTTFVSLAPAGGWSCTTPPVGSGGWLDCSTGSVAAGETTTFALAVRVPTFLGGMLTNTAEVSTASVEFSTSDNSATTTTTLPAGGSDLRVTSFTDAPDPVPVAGQVGFTARVENRGPGASVATRLVARFDPSLDFLFAGPDTAVCSFESASALNKPFGRVVCDLGILPYPGDTSVTITMRATRPGTFRSTATAKVTLAGESDPDDANNELATDTTVNS